MLLAAASERERLSADLASCAVAEHRFESIARRARAVAEAASEASKLTPGQGPQQVEPSCRPVAQC